MLAHRAFELVAPRDEIGKGAGQLAERLFDCAERSLRLADTARNLCFAFGDTRTVLRKPRFFGRETLQRGFRIGLLTLLARDVFDQLGEAAIEFGDALVDARFLTIE